MLTLKRIEMGPEYKHGYERGAVPGIQCSVEFQVGEKSYDNITLKLPDNVVERIAEFIVAEAVQLLVCEHSIDVSGAPGADPEPGDAAADPVI